MEAEAQCAELVHLGLVEGIITDDSDVFLFGGNRVFRNMFNQSKTVECFLSSDLVRELGLDRGTLVRLAYLLGSDYTDGLTGVGPVVAMELVKEFPGDDGLERFAEWWRRVQSGRDKKDKGVSKFRKSFVSAPSLFLSSCYLGFCNGRVTQPRITMLGSDFRVRGPRRYFPFLFYSRRRRSGLQCTIPTRSNGLSRSRWIPIGCSPPRRASFDRDPRVASPFVFRCFAFTQCPLWYSESYHPGHTHTLRNSRKRSSRHSTLGRIGQTLQWYVHSRISVRTHSHTYSLHLSKLTLPLLRFHPPQPSSPSHEFILGAGSVWRLYLVPSDRLLRFGSYSMRSPPAHCFDRLFV